MGRDRDNGPDPLARLASPAPSTQPWGVTGMPSWLDTPEGRNAWAEHDTADPPIEDTERAVGNDDPDWLPRSRAPEPDWIDDDWFDAGDRDSAIADDDGADDDLPGLDSLGDEDDWEDDWEPPRRRLSMLPPAAIGLIVVGLIACAIAGYSLLKQNEPTAPLVAFEAGAQPSAGPSGAGPSAPKASTSDTADDARIIVSVVGLVRRPGLVRIVNTARVADAIAQAGGAQPGADLISLNMAQLLHDGDQILVGKGGVDTVKSAVVAASGATPGAQPPPAQGGSVPTDGTALVDLNAATAEQLEALPGVGPVTAAAIVAWRDANGRFSSVSQLAEVDGIGPARLAKLKPLVTVG